MKVLRQTRSSRHFGILFLLLSVVTEARANIVGPAVQNFNTIPSGVDFLTVHSSKTLEPGMFNLGLFVNHAANALPIFVPNADDFQSHFEINDTLLMSDFNFALGIFRNFELGFSYPRLILQDIDATIPSGQLDSAGNTELRFLAKYRFFVGRRSGMAFILSTNLDQIVNNPYAGKDPLPTINFEWAGDLRINKLVTGLNLGYRWFQPGTRIEGSDIHPTKSQFIASAAASYYMEDLDTKLIGELFGSYPDGTLRGNPTNRRDLGLEALLGVKFDITSNLALQTGMGTGLLSGPATPDWRLYLGVNFAFAVWGQDDEPEKVVVVKKKKKKKKGKKDPEPVEEEEYELPPEVPEKVTTMGSLQAKTGETIVRLKGIQFATDKHDVFLDGSMKTLKLLVQYLRKPPVFTKLVIEGHTDSMGSDNYNLTLSQKRAEHIRKVLTSEFNLDPKKLHSIGYGEGRPIADNGNHQGRQKNRRVDFRVMR